MKKLSVLIIDDNDLDCYLLERELEATNFELTILHKPNGREAIQYLQSSNDAENEASDEFPPHVIFLDINMPFMNGLEFLHQFSSIRESSRFESSKIMMYSSSKNPSDIEVSQQYNFVVGYLVKGEYGNKELEELLGSL